MEHSVEEYLSKQGIEEFDKLAQHIMELKRNTKPNVALISELADILINKKDIKISSLGHIDLSNLVSLTLDKEAVGKNGNLLKTGFASTRHKSRGGETHIIFDMLNNEMDDKEIAYKETEGKLFYELDWSFITQMAERMASNKKEGKYELFNWKRPMTPKGLEDLKQATMRHLLEVMDGKYGDDGRALGHLEAVSANMMMINYQLKLNKS